MTLAIMKYTTKYTKQMKGVPYPFGLIKSVIPSIVDYNIVADRTKRVNIDDFYGLCNIYLYEKDELVEVHSLAEYLGKTTTFEEIEKAFAKEIELYDYIEVDVNYPSKSEVYEYNKSNKKWYMTKQTNGWIQDEDIIKTKVLLR